MTESKRIAVDLDNTLTQGDCKYWEEQLCNPDSEMIEKVNDLYKEGHTVIVWTARPYENAEQVAAFLQRYGVRHHGIRMAKGSADYYIDDKAVPAEQFRGIGLDE